MGKKNQIIKILSGERFTPYTLARKLDAVALLESATFEEGRSRYSLLMLNEAFRVYQAGEEVRFSTDRRRYRVVSKARDILGVLQYFADQHTAPYQDFPFPAGGIGYLAYEFAGMCDSIRFRARKDPLDMPEALFIFGHVFIVFDHYADQLYLIGLNYDEHEIDLASALDETEQRINDLDFNYLQNDDRAYPARTIDDGDPDAYRAGVDTVRQEIIAGNLLQGVLSRRLAVETEIPALEAYRRLRSANPAPYLFYINFKESELFGASPEVHLKVKNGRATMRPIAGTRRRGADRMEDLALERELLEDPKERAEHLMLVDLARNDLGRVCAPGSVEVTQFMQVERYSRVMHIVSQVEGNLAEVAAGPRALRATFPAGTVSGAPKIRAIETIDALEPQRRGFYAGLVGYLEPQGGLDTCIAIRTALKKDGVLYMQAGAGIVYDSDPEKELQETRAKLAALGAAIGVEV
ncbi:MAG: chorismate-binding protein [Alkalispirochaetaceae bacterium]